MPGWSFDLPEPEIIAAPVQPEAAIAFWAWKSATPYNEVKKLDEAGRTRAFYVAGLEEMAQVNKVYDGIGEALKNGETLQDFKARIADVIAEQGWRGGRVETIFRNNLQTAYSAGRYAKMQSVRKARPYRQYVTVGDKRVRPGHAVLNGLIFHADHEFWDENTPPNGHKCRCGVRSLSARQVERDDLTVRTQTPRDMLYTDPKTGMEYHVARPGADDGWRNNPGKTWMDDMRGLAVKKLEDAPGCVAQATVRLFMREDFSLWMQDPRGDFPLVALPEADAGLIGGKSVVGRLSAATFAKQLAHHPELTAQDYMAAQDAVEQGIKIQQDKRNLAYVLDQPEGVVVIVKATMEGDELYVTSLRRMSRDEAERERVIGKLERRTKE